MRYPMVMVRRRLSGPELDDYLAAITRALRRVFSPVRIILFGSFARGDQNRASDIDLVVIAPTELAFCERIGRALEACYAASARLPVEVLVYTPAEWESMLHAGNTFVIQIACEGRTLYDRQSQSDRSAALAEAGGA